MTNDGAYLTSQSLLLSHMSKYDPIVISIEGKKLAIARGFILDLTTDRVIIGLDHRLEETDAMPIGTNLAIHLTQFVSTQSRTSPTSLTHYRIDKDELMAGMGKIRENLAQLFLENGNEKLRELIVDQRKPEFDTSRIKALSGRFPTAHLNHEQVEVLTKVLSAKDYTLVRGMPGTGKTTTIAELIKTLITIGKTVLLTSYTHSAVDHILSKLVDSKIGMLRLGNTDKVSPALRRFTIDEFNPCKSVEELESKLMSPPLVATTSLSIHHPLFKRRKFDYCIVDEAAQVTLPTCLGPLRYAGVFVLIGDHYQLPPLVRNPKAKEGGLELSLFKLLTEAHPDAVVSLTMQYRMNEDIMSLSNALIYDGRLRSADRSLSDLSLKIPMGIATDSFHYMDPRACPERCWISDLMQPERNVVFANTDMLHAKESRIGNRLQNEAEARLTFQLVNAFIRGGIEASEIGVITPYRQQIKLLASLVRDFPNLEILTADKSQGRDKECIIMMMVRKNSEEEVGELLKDWRRINVCLTRAKKKLVIFGSKETLRHSKVLNDFLTLVDRKRWIYDLPADSLEFHQSLDRSSSSSSTTTTASSPSVKDDSLKDSTDRYSNDHHLPPRSKRNANHLSSSPSKPVSSHKRSNINHTLPPRISNSLGVLRDVMVDYLDENDVPPNR